MSGPLIQVDATSKGLNKITAKLEPQVLYRAVRESLEETLVELRDLARSFTPQNTGETAASISYEIDDRGSSIKDLNGFVFSPEEYFSVLEYGRRPGARMPPEGPIRIWLEEKFGIDAADPDVGGGLSGAAVLFLVRRAIGQRGTPALNIMRRALEQGRRRFAIVFMERYLREWGSGGWTNDNPG